MMLMELIQMRTLLKTTPMTPQTTPIHLNPSDETIHLGPLAVRFLVTGEHASGSVALFELTVPGAQRLAAPAHSHDHYEETIYGIEGVLSWTVDGTRIDFLKSGLNEQFVFANPNVAAECGCGESFTTDADRAA